MSGAAHLEVASWHLPEMRVASNWMPAAEKTIYPK